MKIFVVILMFLCISVPAFIYAQNSNNADKKQKEYEKKQEEKTKEADKKYQEAVKKQYQMQSPSTRKKMKKHFKEMQKAANNKKDFFLKRWFNNVFHKRKMKENRNNNGKNPQHKACIPLSPGIDSLFFYS